MKNATILGAGNVATHLSKALLKAGCQINQVYSRTIESANTLAVELNAEAINDINKINDDSDLYIVSISDNAIPEIAVQWDIKNKNVVHTAGSVKLSAFEGAKNHGVFYPLQTFTKSREINFKKLPMCIEACNENFYNKLTNLASKISDSVWQIDSVQRKQLHLSAVFTCNFVNHMYVYAKELIEQKQLPFEILHPLIKETTGKALSMDLLKAQTGPAIRNDTESLKKHIDLLSSTPEIQKIYRQLSDSIYLYHRELGQ